MDFLSSQKWAVENLPTYLFGLVDRYLIKRDMKVDGFSLVGPL